MKITGIFISALSIMLWLVFMMMSISTMQGLYLHGSAIEYNSIIAASALAIITSMITAVLFYRKIMERVSLIVSTALLLIVIMAILIRAASATG